ncbi:hypothetical protein GQ457_16G017510 [Hibiscus cannabinus]
MLLEYLQPPLECSPSSREPGTTSYLQIRLLDRCEDPFEVPLKLQALFVSVFPRFRPFPASVRRARGPVVFSDLERPKLRSPVVRSTPFEPSSEVAMLDLLLAFWVLLLEYNMMSCTAFLIDFVPPDTFLATARVIRPVLIGFWLCASVSPHVRHLCFGQCESSCLAPMLRLG